jgi:hypothetical protein
MPERWENRVPSGRRRDGLRLVSADRLDDTPPRLPLYWLTFWNSRSAILADISQV